MGKKSGWKIYFVLNLLIMLYSLSTVCSKMAAKEEFFSMGFCIYYGIAIMILGLYAICWQQIIKKLPLTVAYANRAMDIVWGILYGMIFFQEKLNAGKAIGALFVIAGVVTYALADNGRKEEKDG